MILKEDGSLDIERVKMLDGDEFEEEMNSWGTKQICEYYSPQGYISSEEFIKGANEIFERKTGIKLNDTI